MLAVWAEALQACFLARPGAPGAQDFAATVVAAARSIQLPAAAELAGSAMRAVHGADPADDGLAGPGRAERPAPRVEPRYDSAQQPSGSGPIAGARPSDDAATRTPDRG